MRFLFNPTARMDPDAPQPSSLPKSIIYRRDVSDYYDPAEPVAADLPLSSGGRVGTVA